MNREVKVLDYGGGVTIFPDNGNAYIYISGESVEKSYDNPPKIILAHELAGHAIPAVVNPSEYDKRFDGLAVTAENIIRSEVGMGLRPMDSYARNDWAAKDMTYMLSRVFYRQMFPKYNF